MIDRGVRSWVLRLAIGIGLTAAVLPGPVASAGWLEPGAADPGAATELAPWTGGVNLYRDGVFTTQASWLYCTAADVQITRNMVEGTSDHSGSAQTAYFDWMRTRNQYDLPLSAGIDPAGWTAGMQHFVSPRYALVAIQSFGYSLTLAVTRMRLTNLPVAITVAHGNHGWVLNGFTATADPAATTDFEITSLSVTGPLWGLQSKNRYDMPPNTTLTVDELRTYFTRWHYDPVPMIWDGTFVSIQPLADGETPPSPSASTPGPPTPPPPTPNATAPPIPKSPITMPPLTLGPTPRPSPTATPRPTLALAVATNRPSDANPGPTADATRAEPAAATGSATWVGLLGFGLLVVALATAIGLVSRSRAARRRE